MLRVLVDPPRLVPDLATSLSLEADGVTLLGVGVEEVELPVDSGLDDELVAAAPFGARKVLFTETDLKLFGLLLTADELRPWPLSSAERNFEVSVSEPPLTLGSAEFTSSSTLSVTCLFSTSSRGPF